MAKADSRALHGASEVASKHSFEVGCEGRIEASRVFIGANTATHNPEELSDCERPLRYHPSMTQTSIRGGTPAVLVGILIIAAAVVSVAVGWLRSVSVGRQNQPVIGR